MKKLTVYDFVRQFVDSDEIPVIIKAGLQELGRFRSLRHLRTTAMPGVLEAKINFVTLKYTEILIQVSLRDFNTKRP